MSRPISSLRSSSSCVDDERERSLSVTSSLLVIFLEMTVETGVIFRVNILESTGTNDGMWGQLLETETGFCELDETIASTIISLPVVSLDKHGL